MRPFKFKRFKNILFLAGSLTTVVSSVYAANIKLGPANLDIGLNALGLLQYGTALSHDWSQVPHAGLSLQEAEIQFAADVDPYFKSVMLFSIAQENGGGFGIDPEELFLETSFLPYVTLKAGKFKLALGKHNALHTHAFPFIDAPLTHTRLLGDEGMNEVGLSVAVLPRLPWYFEMIFQGFNASNESLLKSKAAGDLGGLVKLKNLWDLRDDFTLELGLSSLAGPNQFDHVSWAADTDLTLKWRPLEGGKYYSLTWSTEYLVANNTGIAEAQELTGTEPTDMLGGLVTFIQAQLFERWWTQARYEVSGLPVSVAFPLQQKISALLGFNPSEFSGFKLQYDYLSTQDKELGDHTIALQYSFTLGAHPAHAY